MENTDSVDNFEIDRGFDSLLWGFGAIDLGGPASAIQHYHLQPMSPAKIDD